MIDYKMPEDVDHMPMGRKKVKSRAWVNKYNFKYIIISAGIYRSVCKKERRDILKTLPHGFNIFFNNLQDITCFDNLRAFSCHAVLSQMLV